MKINKIAAFAAAVCLTVIGCGCSPGSSGNSSKADWESTNYTADELDAMGIQSKDNCKLGNETDDDRSKEALRAYNYMLGYAENKTGFEYKIYDYYHVDFDSVKSYVVKIVPKDRAELAEQDENYKLADAEILMLSCSEKATKMKGQIETYLMARRWTEELTAEMKKSFPDYHLNTWYISLDHLVPSVIAEKYSDSSDYTHFFKDDFYEGNIKFYDNCVNLIVPVGTDAEKAEKIFSDAEPILRKYCVTDVRIFSPKSDEIYDKWLSEEEVSGNNYDFKDDEFMWRKYFSLMD